MVTTIVPVGPAFVYSAVVGAPVMKPPSPMDRLEAALEMAPQEALPGLAQELRGGGMSQADLLALFDAARERHECDADETKFDAILDAMDLIVGWCAPSRRLYPDSEPHS